MSVLLTVEAIFDVADIADYIDFSFGEDAAIRFRQRIQERFAKLDRYTHADTGIRYRGNIVYRDVFSPSLIFFAIIENDVHVLRVLREERDWKRMLEEQQQYSYPNE